MTKQAIDNITGVSDGWTFNILNTKDLGLKGVNASGLLAITVGGSKGFSWDISSSGLDISYSGIKDMLFGMKRVKQYNEVMSDKTGELQKIYAAENFAMYGGVSYDSSYIQALEKYMFEGNPDGLSFDFTTKENKRQGNTIYISSEIINGLISTTNGVEGDINQMAVLTAKLAHELKHDGKNEADEQITKQIQGILSNNPSLSKSQLKKMLLDSGLTEDDVDVVLKEVYEDIDAFDFEITIWSGLQKNFRVQNYEMDNLQCAKKMNKGSNYLSYLATFYELGQDKDKIQEDTNAEVNMYLYNQNVMINQRKSGQQVSQEELNALYIARNGFLQNIGMNNYNVQYFNNDLLAFYGLNLIQGQNTELSLVRDYSLLIKSQMNSQFTNAEWQALGCTTDAQKEEYLRTLYGNIFNNVFNTLYTSEEARTNFTIIKERIASHFNTTEVAQVHYAANSTETVTTGGDIVNGYSNSIMWMFELYRNYTNGGNISNAYNFETNNLSYPGQYTGQGVNNSFFQYYLIQNSDDLNQLGNLLEGKTINVKDSVPGNGTCNTHFIANIGFLITLLTDLRNGIQGVNNNNDWVSLDWYEGYRTLKEGGSTNNGHTLNSAIDFLNIKVNNGNGGTTYLSAEQQYYLMRYFANTGHYNWKEWKKGYDLGDTDHNGYNEFSGGYHLGLTGGNSSVFGSTKEWTSKNSDGTYNFPAEGFDSENGDSWNAMDALLRSLGIKDNFSNYYTYYNGFYYINYAAIDEYLWNKAVSNLNNNNYIVQ